MKITFKGTPITLEGYFPIAGDYAPLFALVKNDMTEFTSNENHGHYLILNIFPSLDTDVCAASVRRFNQMAGNLPVLGYFAFRKTYLSPKNVSVQ